MKVSVTFLKHKTTIASFLEEINKTDADYIHVDVMDGEFVSNTFLSIEETLKELENYQDKLLDVHLMATNPSPYIEAFKDLNIENVTIHVEINQDIKKIINRIHELGFKAGLALNPETSVDALNPYLNSIDYVIIMGVNPGAGGQKLIPETIEKITDLRKLREENNYHYLISLDGGVNEETRSMLGELDVIICGSYIALSNDMQESINNLR